MSSTHSPTPSTGNASPDGRKGYQKAHSASTDFTPPPSGRSQSISSFAQMSLEDRGFGGGRKGYQATPEGSNEASPERIAAQSQQPTLASVSAAEETRGRQGPRAVVVPPTPLEGDAHSNPFSHRGAEQEGFGGRKGYQRSPSLSPIPSPRTSPRKAETEGFAGRKGYQRSPSPSPASSRSASPRSQQYITATHEETGLKGRKGYQRSPSPSPVNSRSASPRPQQYITSKHEDTGLSGRKGYQRSPSLSPSHSRQPSPTHSTHSFGSGRKGYQRSPSPSLAHSREASPTKVARAHSRSPSPSSRTIDERRRASEGGFGGRKGYQAPVHRSTPDSLEGGFGGRKGYQASA